MRNRDLLIEEWRRNLAAGDPIEDGVDGMRDPGTGEGGDATVRMGGEVLWGERYRPNRWRRGGGHHDRTRDMLTPGKRRGVMR